MSISSHIDKAKKMTTYTVTDKLTFDEAMAEVKLFYNRPTKNVMWDLRSVSELKFSTEEVKTLAGLDKRIESSNRINGKTAIVATQDLYFGLGRVFKTLSEMYKVPFTVMIFRTMKEAEKWFEND